MDSLLGVSVGLALSAAVGLRIFVPLLITSAAAQLGCITLAAGMTWIGSNTALVAFATATVIEVVAYYVPVLDNLLDTIATPVATTAGVITMAAVTPDLPPSSGGRSPSSPVAGPPVSCRPARPCFG